jgi:hypothetical protein
MRSGLLSKQILTCLVGVAIAVMVVRIGLTWRVFSDVIDEPYHIGAGVSMYEARKLVRGIQSPPLPRLVGALPLMLSGIRWPQDRGLTTIQTDLNAFDVGKPVLSQSQLSYWSVLTRARAAMLVFPIIAVVYVYLLGRFVGGAKVGCLAAIFFSTDPTLLGHSTWVTTDVAAAAGFLAATFHGIRFIAHPCARRALPAGVALGLALACKFSCALVVPALLLVMLVRRRAWPRMRQLGLAAICAFIAMWACYFFDVGKLGDRVATADDGLSIPAWLENIPIPMPSAVLGYLDLAHHVRLGHSAYLNGQISDNGWWYYFPEAIALKSPIALLIGVAGAGAIAFLLRRRPWLRWATLAFPPAIFLAAAMAGGLNLGIRHVLPVLPFLYLVVAQVLNRARLGPAVIGLIMLAFIETFWVHPDYLAFFNALAGGPSQGSKYLLDSNLDWGQDQARLKQWLDEHAKARQVTLRIFGVVHLPEWPHEGYEFVPAGESPHGLLAISKQIAAGSDMRGMARRHLAQIGYSIDIYDLDQPGGP